MAVLPFLLQQRPIHGYLSQSALLCQESFSESRKNEVGGNGYAQLRLLCLIRIPLLRLN